jgi:hypothetical protein
MPKKISTTDIIQDLGDGLILRSATPDDAEMLSEFNSRTLSDNGPDEPDEGVRAWTHDLLTRPHPTFKPGDFTLVQDTKTGQIISSLNLISQTWTYGGIPFGVGRPEVVSTLPEYRNRGLVRKQFDVIHRWSAERGEKLQAITGIPYYYRQFGYEMALDLGGGRSGSRRFVPKLEEGVDEPFNIRPATEQDIPFVASLYEQARQRYLVDCVRDTELWRYELEGKSQKNINRMELYIIETRQAKPVGYVWLPWMNWGPTITVFQYEIQKGFSWAQVTPSLVRFVFALGEIRAAEKNKQAEFDSFYFSLGREHPVYQVMHDSLPRKNMPYAWYIRIPDLPGFVKHVSPVLENNLVNSAYSDYSGELRLTFYHSGLQLILENGKLATITSYKPTPTGHTGEAAFPGLSFLQLLFGYRTLDELHYAFPDCWYKNDEIYGVLTALFPSKPSNILGIT